MDTSQAYTPEDIRDNKAMAILSYIGILVLVPLLAAKDSPYARFHTNQGLVLFIGEAILSIILGIVQALALRSLLIFTVLSVIVSLLWIPFAVWAIMGIVHAAQGQAKELPLIGHIRILN